MGKVTIEIEDNLITGEVKFVMTPSFEQMMLKQTKTTSGLTAAEAYAVSCARHVLKLSKDRKSPILVNIPRLKGMG